MASVLKRADAGSLRAIIVGGGIAGLLDIVYACSVTAITAKVPPDVVLKAVASGLYGRGAYQGGSAMAALGLFFHFAMTLAMAATFVAAARRMPALTSRPVLSGIGYGLLIYVTMNYVVLPLSAFPGAGRAPPLASLLGGLAIHAFGVGLPIALAARRYANR